MAGDLIPPPSPSGRPSPDAMRNVTRRGTPELVEIVEPEAGASAAPEPSQFRSRFGFVLGALVGVSVAAVAAVALLIGTKPDSSADRAGLAGHWSSWFPPSDDIFSGPAAIANHVQTQYKRADGKQLVIVHGGPLLFAGAAAPLQFAVRLQPSDGSIRDLGTDGVFYTLSGTGTSGTIVGDKATPARQRLLRREALELALYSFRYVSNISMFVALLPTDEPKAKNGKKPKPVPVTEQTLQAVFFRPGDLKRQLQSPLTNTLKPSLKLGPKQLAPDEVKRIDALTEGNMFTAHFVQQVDGQLYLVLKSAG